MRQKSVAWNIMVLEHCIALPGKAGIVSEDEIKDRQSHVFLSLDRSLSIIRWNQITAVASTVS